ncbi:hypothetical protein [Burkholderia gladioli]|uniref:hypothetical protein n=1 Tax=Burkholderia gladioli TaxID=28095 RepID=UPI00163ECC65|nr:hypothetical protein [Burkholderia gladioli]
MFEKPSAFMSGPNRNRQPAVLLGDPASAVSCAQADAVWELLAECCGFDPFVGSGGECRSDFVARMTDEHLPLQWRTWQFTSIEGYDATFSLSQMLISNCSNEPSQSWISRLMRANYALRRLMLAPVVAS